MKVLFKHYRTALLVLILPYAFMIFLFAYEVDLYIRAPGGISEVSDIIEINYQEDKVIEGTISSTYVMSYPKVTYFQFLIGSFSPYTSIGVSSQTTYTVGEIIQISYLDKETSVNAAIIVAYMKAAETNPEIEIAYEQKTLIYGKAEYLEHYDEISFGDEFVQMVGDGGVIATDSNGISEYSTVGNAYEFTFLNEEDEEYQVTITKNEEYGLFGFTLKTYYIVDQDLTYPTFTEKSSNIGGPSGGLLQTLSVYNMLIDDDLTHGLKIAGTGTISYDGSVGYIGAVEQKIVTAYYNKVDIFFIPALDADYYYDDYQEALRACQKFNINPDGWLIPVSTFDEAVAYLEGLG